MKSFRLIVLFLLFSLSLSAQTSQVYVIEIKQEIGSTSWIYLKEGLAEAKKRKADLVILHLNTYGGAVEHADSMRMAILNFKAPVVSFVDMNAASAGALISLACDSVYMRMGASMGAATVVGQTGEQMPDKYQSYMRSTMRATAEAHGKDTITDAEGNRTAVWRRDPLIAEAMVDDRIAVAGVSDSGKVLTFTAEEAVKHRFSEGIVVDIEQIITEKFGFTEYETSYFRPTLWDDIAGFLSNPALKAILIMVIIGGIYFELQTPGIGFPLAASLLAALLYFSPLFIGGLATYWEVAIFIIGLILIVLEVFVIPGFGVVGIVGIILTIAGLSLALVDNVGFQFGGVAAGQVTGALVTVLSGIIASFFLILYLSHKIGSKGMFRHVALQRSLNKEDGYEDLNASLKHLLGAEGTAATDLRPSGKVTIGTDRYDAISEDGFVNEGTPVKVVKVENMQIYVRLK